MTRIRHGLKDYNIFEENTAVGAGQISTFVQEKTPYHRPCTLLVTLLLP